ncbi:MAG: VanW family protein [Anaerolineales bacterium]
MSTRIESRRPVNLPSAQIIAQGLFALVGGMALFAILLLGLVIGFNLYYSGQIYPGISVAGVNLSGLRPEEAQALLASQVTYPQDGRIVLQEGDQVWIASPKELGLYLDPQTSAMVAYQMGRQGGLVGRFADQFRAWFLGLNLPPYLVYDERVARAYLDDIAVTLELPTVEASISVKGTQVTVLPGQVGRSVDRQATLAPLESQLRSLTDGMLTIVIEELPPAILDASEQAQIAERILSAPLTLVSPDAQEGETASWTFDQESLAEMLTIERADSEEGSRYQVGLDRRNLNSFLEGIAGDLARQPANARFIFNDETRQLEVIQPSVTGRTLNVPSTLQAVNEKLVQGDHNVELVFDYTEPQVSDKATAEQLGIRELVSQHRSYFYGSSAERIQNIETAAGRFHGLLVPPGATFSMGEALGDVSLDNGYAEALIIFGNRTIKGVGGGVCQVSTTLFRTVFLGGYPIVERHPHAYRVGYYEQTAQGGYDPDLAGLDATVFVPVVDFKFTNDTPNWLLMETYVNAGARTLTWKFYSTSEGRTVEWDTTGLQNVEDPPEPQYQENPDLDKGEIRQVDWEAAGADVTVFRTVYKDGQVYLEDQYATHYMPWRAVYEYGPGTKIPKDKNNDD